VSMMQLTMHAIHQQLMGIAAPVVLQDGLT
jgi:hypothetical protein